MRKFSLELTLEDIRKRGAERGYDFLEISSKGRVMRISLREIDDLALVSD